MMSGGAFFFSGNQKISVRYFHPRTNIVFNHFIKLIIISFGVFEHSVAYMVSTPHP